MRANTYITASICGLWRNLYTSLLYFVMRVRCRHKERSRLLSHFLMSFLFHFMCSNTVTRLATILWRYLCATHLVAVDMCAFHKRSKLFVGYLTTAYCLFFSSFLTRCMRCRRGLAMSILSVCLSVCLSVSLSIFHTRGLWQNGIKIWPDLYTIWKNI